MNRAADSPSPLNGGRAGVRGEKVRLASSLERRFMESENLQNSDASWGHEPGIPKALEINKGKFRFMGRAGVRMPRKASCLEPIEPVQKRPTVLPLLRGEGW